MIENQNYNYSANVFECRISILDETSTNKKPRLKENNQEDNRVQQPAKGLQHYQGVLPY